ncbi:uncharacterized protein Z518_06517 [Rhinocladiella mackenziei CBS 650.93]|uniref:Uncharacterized protein n=1 Tax=Rhinocladiella mackenziei CBS 650.93 TaxID=1442369 RepID=A0A0D2FLV8_9EURO|nr:uncharacterized protein Z518_06517 [Rhinocladiella mackenziei CBS 650.93]KIX02967.1 hypothetical protein Z518_06517 [Rhinocladiella mackenziei CBS 650.93]
MASQIEMQFELPSGAVKSAKFQMRRDHPDWSDDQIKDAIRERFLRDHENCKAGAYHQVLANAEARVREVVCFFVGPANYNEYKKNYAQIWANKDKNGGNKFLKPWYFSAYEYHHKNMVWDDNCELKDVSQVQRLVMKVGCKKHHQQHTLQFPLTLAMKLVVGGLSRDQWNWYCTNSSANMSHLNGAGGDINPLNYHPETAAINLGRKPCHTLANVMGRPDVFCRNHNEPKCHLDGCRMQKNWPRVVGEMIQLARNGRAAMDAYDVVDHVIR